MPTIELQRGRIIRLREALGTTVTARTGAVWITEENSRRDIVLTPGRSFTFARPGVALVQALRDASVAIGGAPSAITFPTSR